MSEDDREARRLDLMRNSTTMTLATCADNVPWATDVYFVSVGYDLWFVSSANSRHCANLKRNAVCAATIHPATSDWRAIRGLQFAGRAEPSTAADDVMLLAPYFRKFPFAEQVYAGLKAGAGATGLVVYRFSTDRVWFIDNSLGFGSKTTAAVEGGRAGDFLKA